MMRISRVRIQWLSVALVLTAFLSLAGSMKAEGIYVPNFSFEDPDIGTNSPYAAPVFESWEETAQPSWYNPADFQGSPWSYLAGTFYNLPNFTNSMGTNDTFIFNCDGIQASYFQAVPQVGALQSLDATFDPGKTYTLTVGLIGGGGGMPIGSTFQLSLYYMDGTNMVTVAQTTATNTDANFPTDSQFVDFAAQVPEVHPADPWAGKNIGIQLLATPDFFDPSQWGGYWDADNVRLTEQIVVSNFSFELPNIGTNSPYAAPVLQTWEQTPQPSWYNPADFQGSPWSYLAGTFYNLPNFTNSMGTNDTFIFNCDGIQATYFQAVPQVGIFENLDAIFDVGKAYTLTVGLLGGGGGMPVGSTFQISLYYLDTTNMETVAMTTATNTPANFPADTNFTDFQVNVPSVRASDPWAGQNIGIELLATPDFFDPSQWGGYWDADNVRLVESTPLSLVNPSLTNAQLQFFVQSEPGAVLQILSTTNLSLPQSGWTNLETFTNTTGAMPYVDPSATVGQRFYTVKRSP